MDKRAPAAVSLASLRAEFDKEKIDAYILSTYDAHSSEYPAARFKRVAAVSGFGGSMGTVVVTRDRALLFCDPRYWEEAANTMAAGFELVKEGGQDRVTYKTWLREHLPRGARLGYDPEQLTVERLDDLTKALPSAHVVPVEGNLVDRLWPAQPALSAKGCWPHPESLAGETASRKLARLRAELAARHCTAAVLSALDQSMWLLNLRGADSYESPVVYCYTLITAATAKIYILDWKRVPSETIAYLTANEVLLDSYEQFYKDLAGVASAPDARVWLERHSTNSQVWQAAQAAQLESGPLPIDLWKATKNPAEQAGMRDCHLRDAAALTRFLAWVTEEARTGRLTETQACARLEAFRAEEEGFVAPSFSTIMGSGANGAIIHYHPSELRPALVSPDAMLLVDSGGHYTSGTTDVTRTIHTGTPTAHQKRCYTRVLQGHVDMARAVVSSAVRGEQLDILARLPLFADGLDYRHGTGHGVGAYLNVHESPPSVNGGRGSAHYDGPLLPGFIFSDEPGYYESGSFGIRIESLLLANPVATRHTFHSPYYLGFENLTLVPFSRQLIDAELLSREQVEYIDAFHRRCREQIGPRLAQRDPKAHRFLMRETRPLRPASRLRLPPAALPLIITASAALVFGAYLFGSSRAASSSPK